MTYQSLGKGLYVIERVREMGQMTVGMLARTPGWCQADASRYLQFLAQLGWLEKVSDQGRPRYVLGRKALALTPDLQF